MDYWILNRVFFFFKYMNCLYKYNDLILVNNFPFFYFYIIKRLDSRIISITTWLLPNDCHPLVFSSLHFVFVLEYSFFFATSCLYFQFYINFHSTCTFKMAFAELVVKSKGRMAVGCLRGRKTATPVTPISDVFWSPWIPLEVRP